MTISEVKTMVESIGYSATYYEFQGAAPSKPFIVWYFPQSADFYADGQNYQKIEQLNIELYTYTKNFEAEAAVESVLKSNGLAWTREEQMIDQESGYEVLYITEVLLNGEQSQIQP